MDQLVEKHGFRYGCRYHCVGSLGGGVAATVGYRLSDDSHYGDSGQGFGLARGETGYTGQVDSIRFRQARQSGYGLRKRRHWPRGDQPLCSGDFTGNSDGGHLDTRYHR